VRRSRSWSGRQHELWARIGRDDRARSLLLVGVLAPIGVALAGWLVASALGLTTHEYLSGIIPTLMGVVAGLPLALWLVRVAEDVGTRRENNAAAARRRLVTGVIRQELEEALAELRGDRAERPRPMIVPFLKTEAWRALADGGELRWVDDPELIARVARAYHRIETTTLLERAIFDYINDPVRGTIQFTGAGAVKPLDRLVLWVAGQDEHTIAAIDHALAGIRAAAE
jgi:hypothetical protein